MSFYTRENVLSEKKTNGLELEREGRKLTERLKMRISYKKSNALPQT